MAVSRIVTLALLAALAAGADVDNHVHGHGDEKHDWEWAGIFSLEAGEHYAWTFARGDSGSYAAPTMKFAFLPASTVPGYSGDMHEVEEVAEELWDNASWTEVASGSTLQLGTASGQNLRFDTEHWLTTFYLNVPANGDYIFLAEHMPAEFENRFHYLKDEHGRDVVPKVEEPGELSAETSEAGQAAAGLGVAVLAAGITALPALFMILMVIPLLHRINAGLIPGVFAFASGAIFSCAVFLLLAEGLHLAGEGQDEVTGTWTWGVAIMAGWLLGLVIHHFCDIVFSARGKSGESEKKDAEVGETLTSCTTAATKWEVAGPVIFGDFWHNMVDGMVIGIAAKSCDSSMLWGIVGATVAHEAPQEVADFVVLVKKAGLSWPKALLANALSGVPPAVIGAIITYEAEVSNNAQGVLLAFGGGVYLFVAMTELAEQMLHMEKPSVFGSLLRLGCFALGAILIGLVLLDHKHCDSHGGQGGHGGHGAEAVAAADPHAGHGH